MTEPRIKTYRNDKEIKGWFIREAWVTATPPWGRPAIGTFQKRSQIPLRSRFRRSRYGARARILPGDATPMLGTVLALCKYKGFRESLSCCTGDLQFLAFSLLRPLTRHSSNTRSLQPLPAMAARWATTSV